MERLPSTLVGDALSLARRLVREGAWLEAESVLLDVLEVAPEHAEALAMRTTVVVARGDGPELRVSATSVNDVLGELPAGAERSIVRARLALVRGRELLRERVPGFVARAWFERALGHYEAAYDADPTAEALAGCNLVRRLLANNDSLAEGDL